MNIKKYIIEKESKKIYEIDEVYEVDSENIVVFTINGPCLPINEIKINPSIDDVKDSIVNRFGDIIDNISKEDLKKIESRIGCGNIPKEVSIFTLLKKRIIKLMDSPCLY
jgi:hypothetical protein